MSKKWNPPYRCLYCNNILYNKDYLYKVHLYAQNTKKDRILTFNCHDCQAWFKYSVLHKKTVEASFFVDNIRSYLATIDFETPTFTIHHFKPYTSYSTGQTSISNTSEKVISLSYIPRNWSPKTAEEKLKLYLLFS